MANYPSNITTEEKVELLLKQMELFDQHFSLLGRIMTSIQPLLQDVVSELSIKEKNTTEPVKEKLAIEENTPLLGNFIADASINVQDKKLASSDLKVDIKKDDITKLMTLAKNAAKSKLLKESQKALEKIEGLAIDNLTEVPSDSLTLAKLPEPKKDSLKSLIDTIFSRDVISLATGFLTPSIQPSFQMNLKDAHLNNILNYDTGFYVDENTGATQFLLNTKTKDSDDIHDAYVFLDIESNSPLIYVVRLFKDTGKIETIELNSNNITLEIVRHIVSIAQQSTCN